jgi:hypothetical protein
MTNTRCNALLYNQGLTKIKILLDNISDKFFINQKEKQWQEDAQSAAKVQWQETT